MSPVPQVKPQLMSLKARIFHAGSWILAGHFAALVLRLFGTLVLTRIFTPDVFGILAILFAIQMVISLLTDIGLVQAVIQSPNGGDRLFLNTAWTVQVMRGWLIWSFGVVAAAGLYGAGEFSLLPKDSVYSVPHLPALIVAAAFSAVIVGFQSMKVVTASRDLNLKRITAVELISQIVGFVFIVIVGWLTRSIWAYIGGGLLISVITVLLTHFYLVGPRDRFAWDPRSLRELSRFGKWIFLSSATSTLAVNGDRFLLAGWVQPAVLGYYSIAFNLASVAEGVINRLFGGVSLPALSEIARQQPQRFPELYYRMRWVSDSLIVGAAGFLFASGRGVVELLYDPRYWDAGWMLQWLSFYLVFVRFGLTQNAYLALGKPNYVTIINVTKVISLFIFVPVLFYLFGMSGAIVGIAFHMAPCTLWIFYFNRMHGLNNFRLEAAQAGFWVVGWLVGSVTIRFLSLAKSFALSYFV